MSNSLPTTSVWSRSPTSRTILNISTDAANHNPHDHTTHSIQRSPLSSPLYGEIMSPSDFIHTSHIYYNTTNNNNTSSTITNDDDSFSYDSIERTFIPPHTPEKSQSTQPSSHINGNTANDHDESVTSDAVQLSASPVVQGLYDNNNTFDNNNTHNNANNTSNTQMSSAFPTGLFNTPFNNTANASTSDHTRNHELINTFNILNIDNNNTYHSNHHNNDAGDNDDIIDRDSDDEVPYFYGSIDAPGYDAYQQHTQLYHTQHISVHNQHQTISHSNQSTDPINNTNDNISSSTTTSNIPESTPKTWSSLLKNNNNNNNNSIVIQPQLSADVPTNVIPNEYPVDPPTTTATTPHDSSKPCIFFLQGICRYGAHCMNKHEFIDNVCPQCDQYIDGTQHEHIMHQLQCIESIYTQYERMSSYNVLCGICYESPIQCNRRFGLLSDCPHVYCVECIRQYKSGNTDSDSDNLSHTLKSCALCDTQSKFIIPSDRIIVDPIRKQRVIDEYKYRLSTIPCRNYNDRGTCMFGNNCLYSHHKTNTNQYNNNNNHVVHNNTAAKDNMTTQYHRATRKDTNTSSARQLKLSDYLFPSLDSSTNDHILDTDTPSNNAAYAHHNSIQYTFTSNAVIHEQPT